MKRSIYQKLLAWKNSATRKPLILRGARQTGKTYILRDFASREYEQYCYFNFEETPEIADFFSRNLKPEKIIAAMSLYLQRPIDPSKELLIFDEIQTCNAALASLKYFQEEHPEYHIAVAGSLLGIKMSKPGTFPVGKVNLMSLHPMTFLEFLDATGHSAYRELIENRTNIEELALPFHNDLIELLRLYYFIGGMPEAVQTYISTSDLKLVRNVQNEILNTYELDFAKHAPSSDIPKLSAIWHSIPKFLARENKRFIFSALRQSARGRDYADAIQWLKDAGLICQATAISHIELPLIGFAEDGIFKVYALDTGLLGALSGISATILSKGSDLFQTFHGAFVENFVAQQLSELRDTRLFYWKSEGKKAEVDFILEYEGAILPLEVKAGVNPRSKSMQSYDYYHSPRLLLRATLLNLKHDGKTLNIPLYAIGALERLIAVAVSHSDNDTPVK